MEVYQYAWFPSVSALIFVCLFVCIMSMQELKSANKENHVCWSQLISRFWFFFFFLSFFPILVEKIFPVLSPLLQTAAMTGTLPHPGHKTLRKWERCHPKADITPHWSPVIHQTFTNHHARRRLCVAETWTGTGTGMGQIRWTTKAGNLNPIIITPGITITVKVPPDSSLLTTATAVAMATRRAGAAKSRSLSRRAASLNS